jgi:VCBS repeat-containing protein
MAESTPLMISNQIIVEIDGVTKGDGSDHVYGFTPPGMSRPIQEFKTWDADGRSQNSLPGGEKNIQYGTFAIEFAGTETAKAAHEWLMESVDKGAESQKDVTVEVKSADGSADRTYNFVGCEIESVQPSAFRAGDSTVDTYTLTAHPTSMTIE